MGRRAPRRTAAGTGRIFPTRAHPRAVATAFERPLQSPPPALAHPDVSGVEATIAVATGRRPALLVVNPEWVFVSHRLGLPRALKAQGYELVVAARVQP